MGTNMHVDIRHIKVCALCAYWNDKCQNHVDPSSVSYHYYYDSQAREMCLHHRHDTYGGQCACGNYECKFKK